MISGPTPVVAFIAEGSRASALSVVLCPDDVDAAAFRSSMINVENVALAAVWQYSPGPWSSMVNTSPEFVFVNKILTSLSEQPGNGYLSFWKRRHKRLPQPKVA